MKNIIRFIAFFVTVVLAFACTKPEESKGQEQEKVVPVFPALVENYKVTPGEKLTFSFTPNMDWEISIPQEAFQWFQLMDGTFKMAKISGKASDKPVTVTVQVSEQEEFDTNRSVDVSLTMGGETKVIAKYMRPAKNRSIAIYPAELNADGTFKLSDDGTSYVYSSEPVETMTLVWSAQDADFRAPLKVVSNFSWKLDIPEWAETKLPESIADVEEIVITGSSIEAAQGKALFKAGDDVLKEVALSIPSCAEIKIYSAQHQGDEWLYSDEGDFLWTESAVTEVNLAWMGTDYRMPVKIDSRCNWELECPEWMNLQLPEDGVTSGVISLNMRGVPSKYPMDDTSGAVIFKYKGTKIYEIKVSIPGSRNLVYHSLDMQLTDLEFNYTGQFNTSTGYVEPPVNATIQGTSLSCIVPVEFKDGNYMTDADVEWLVIDAQAYSKAEGADVIQTREVKISVKENVGVERNAVIFFLPYLPEGGIAALFNAAKTEIKEEYLEYAVTVVQHSSDMDYLTINATEEAMADAGAEFSPASETLKAELLAAFGETNYVYSLVYTKEYANETAVLTLARPFTSIKIFGQDKAELPEGSWLQYKEVNEGAQGEITMYLGKNLPLEPSVGYVVFYHEDIVLAIVECTSPKIEPTINMAQSYLAFTAQAGEGTITFDCNVDWTVTSGSDWCTVSPAEGKAGSAVAVNVTVTENKAEAREAKLTVSYGGKSAEISITQEGAAVSDGPKYEFSNGDSTVHFVNPTEAEEAGATLYHLTSGEIYDSYKEGSTPVYHLVYTKDNTKLNITIPRTAKVFINNPYKYSSYFSVNETVYGEYFGPNGLLNEVVRDSKGSVSIRMTMPEDMDFMRGNINFTGQSSVSTTGSMVIILVCTLDLTE